MKKFASSIMVASFLSSGVAVAAEGDLLRDIAGPLGASVIVSSLPTLLIEEVSASAAGMDRKILVERIANDALLNLETNEKTILLQSVMDSLREKHTELATVDDKAISKRLIQEAIALSLMNSK